MGEQPAQLPLSKRLLCAGGASVLSEICTLPIDVVKVRLQVQGSRAMLTTTHYSSMFAAFPAIVRNEGVTALWKGIKPACLRQATYGSMRLGLYDPIKAFIHRRRKSSEGSPLWEKVAAGTISGALAAAICTPTDLIKIRMQGDVTGQGKAPRYAGLVDAFTSIVKEDGWKGLYKGVSPTVQRAAVLAAAELATYDEAEYQIISRGWMQKGFGAYFVASLIAGLVAAVVSSPADVIKSRVMNQQRRPDGTLNYRSTVDCAVKSVREEGLLSLWKGLLPNYARLAPSVCIMFIAYEALKSMC